jgi:hypothetical protein
LSELEKKVDRLTRLLEDQELAAYHASSSGGSRKMVQELVINTILASVVGYFMFRILDIHFRPQTK